MGSGMKGYREVLLSAGQGAVKAERGITYPSKGSASSTPNDAGLAGYTSGGDLSTTDTLPSAAHAQPHSQLASCLEGTENLRNQLTGCPYVCAIKQRQNEIRNSDNCM